MIAFRCAALGAHGRFSAYTKCSWISRWHSFLLISQLLGVVFFSHESHRCSPVCFQIYLSKSRYCVELHHPPGWKNILNWNLDKFLSKSDTSMIARGFPWVPTSHTLPSGRCSWSSVSVLPPLKNPRSLCQRFPESYLSILARCWWCLCPSRCPDLRVFLLTPWERLGRELRSLPGVVPDKGAAGELTSWHLVTWYTCVKSRGFWMKQRNAMRLCDVCNMYIYIISWNLLSIFVYCCFYYYY